MSEDFDHNALGLVGDYVMYDERGRQIWYRNGKIHRDNGPAITYPDGMREEWYHDGLLHRLDGPAASYDEQGIYIWYLNGIIHRHDGPAVINRDGTQEWFQNGSRHRLDGPAWYTEAKSKWFLHGEEQPIVEFRKNTIMVSAIIEDIDFDLSRYPSAQRIYEKKDDFVFTLCDEDMCLLRLSHNVTDFK